MLQLHDLINYKKNTPPRETEINRNEEETVGATIKSKIRRKVQKTASFQWIAVLQKDK